MKANDIIRMAHDIIDSCAIENDYIEYKKSADIKDGILKTACAFSNNYMKLGLFLLELKKWMTRRLEKKLYPSDQYLE